MIRQDFDREQDVEQMIFRTKWGIVYLDISAVMPFCEKMKRYFPALKKTGCLYPTVSG